MCVMMESATSNESNSPSASESTPCRCDDFICRLTATLLSVDFHPSVPSTDKSSPPSSHAVTQSFTIEDCRGLPRLRISHTIVSKEGSK